MQEVLTSKAAKAGVVVFAAVLAFVCALFVAQPAQAKQTPSLGVQDAQVMIDDSVDVAATNAVAGQTGKWEWKADNACVELSNTDKETVTVKGVSDGTVKLTCTFTTDAGVAGTATATVTVTGVKAASKKTVGKIVYKRNGIDTVVAVQTKGKKDLKKKTLKIPATVKIADKSGFKATYKVTEIAAKAFKHQKKKTTKVVVGKNVVKIGKHAFCGSKKLKSLVIGASVEVIGQKIVHIGCPKLKTVTVKSKKLKTVKNCFKSSKVKTVKVPKASKKAYKKLFKKCGKKVKVK